MKIDRFYEVRKKVADKRLRVKGRFVTNDQALKLLGITYEDLRESKELQQLFEDQASVQYRLDSIFQAKNGQRTHIKNLQVLFEQNIGASLPKDADFGAINDRLSRQQFQSALLGQASENNGLESSLRKPTSGPGQFFILGQQPVPELSRPAELDKRQPCESCERYFRIFSLAKRPIFRIQRVTNRARALVDPRNC